MKLFQGLEQPGRELSSYFLGKLFQPEKTQLNQLRSEIASGRIQKILLVRNYQGIGDLLCATPAIAALKEKLPNARIHFLANTFNAAALQNNPHLEKIWLWNERKKGDPRHWFYFRRELRREKFDLALVLSGNALSLTAILLADLSGARWVTGYETASYGQNWGERLYSCEIPRANSTREIDAYAEIVEGLGIPCKNRAPEFFLNPKQRAFADAFWQRHFANEKRPVAGIFLGGKTDRPDRIWPPAYYAQVARALTQTHHCAVLVITPPAAGLERKRETTFWLDESVHAREFAKAFGQECPVFRDADLGRVGAILSKLQLFICPDGGMMHVAAGLRVPTLTLFFGTNPDIWHPPVPSSHYIAGAKNDPRSLLPERVIEEAVNLLGVHA